MLDDIFEGTYNLWESSMELYQRMEVHGELMLLIVVTLVRIKYH